MCNCCRYIIIALFLTLSVESFSQSYEDSFFHVSDTITQQDVFFESELDLTVEIQKKDTMSFKPNPARAVWLGAIIPGYGQVVNKKYWKLPFIYGGFLGVAYITSWNSNLHQSYKMAYRDIIDKDSNTNSFLEILPKGYSVEDIFGSQQKFEDHLKMGYERTRRYRDLSILGTILYCGLTVLEAYVDAELYDFDISPDLSMRIEPAITNENAILHQNNPFNSLNKINYNSSFGVKCAFKLK